MYVNVNPRIKHNFYLTNINFYEFNFLFLTFYLKPINFILGIIYLSSLVFLTLNDEN